MPKRDKQGVTNVVRPAPGHSSSLELPMSLVTPPRVPCLIQDLTPGSGCGTTRLWTPSTPVAFQVAKNLMSLLTVPIPQDSQPAQVTGDKRKQGVLSSTVSPPTTELSRGKPSMVLILRSLACHQSQVPQHCSEVEEDTMLPWNPRGRNPLQSLKWNPSLHLKPTGSQPTHWTSGLANGHWVTGQCSTGASGGIPWYRALFPPLVGV